MSSGYLFDKVVTKQSALCKPLYKQSGYITDGAVTEL